MTLEQIPTLDRNVDARETLAARAGADDGDLFGVVLIELYRDGARRIITNRMSYEEKCFAACFLNSMINSFFGEDEER